MMSCCQPPPTARSACVASLNPMPTRLRSSTALASSYQDACTSPNTSCRPSPPALDLHLLDQKCSADFSAKLLFYLDQRVDSAQVGLNSSHMSCTVASRVAQTFGAAANHT